MNEFPKTLSDPTGTQVPDRVVNNAAEESAARTAGFTVVVADAPGPNPTVAGTPSPYREPFVQHPAENITGLNTTAPGPGAPFDTAAYLETQGQFKALLGEIHGATTHESREAALTNADAMVIQLEEQAVAAEHAPSAIRRQADILRRELNIARYVSAKNIAPRDVLVSDAPISDPSNPNHPAFALRNPGAERLQAQQAAGKE